MAALDGWTINKKIMDTYKTINTVLSKHERVIVVLARKIEALEKLHEGELNGKDTKVVQKNEQDKPKVSKVVQASKQV